MYEGAWNFLSAANELLLRGKSGDDVARKTYDAFEAVPAALRQRWGTDGAYRALKRIEKTGGPLQELVERIYAHAVQDPEYGRRMQDMWGCIADAGDVSDEEDIDFTPGESENEDARDNENSGGVIEPAPEREGAPCSECFIPDASGGTPTPKGEEEATEGEDTDDGGDVDTSVDGTGGE